MQLAGYVGNEFKYSKSPFCIKLLSCASLNLVSKIRLGSSIDMSNNKWLERYYKSNFQARIQFAINNQQRRNDDGELLELEYLSEHHLNCFFMNRKFEIEIGMLMFESNQNSNNKPIAKNICRFNLDGYKYDLEYWNGSISTCTFRMTVCDDTDFNLKTIKQHTIIFPNNDNSPSCDKRIRLFNFMKNDTNKFYKVSLKFFEKQQDNLIFLGKRGRFDQCSSDTFILVFNEAIGFSHLMLGQHFNIKLDLDSNSQPHPNPDSNLLVEVGRISNFLIIPKGDGDLLCVSLNQRLPNGGFKVDIRVYNLMSQHWVNTGNINLINYVPNNIVPAYSFGEEPGMGDLTYLHDSGWLIYYYQKDDFLELIWINIDEWKIEDQTRFMLSRKNVNNIKLLGFSNSINGMIISRWIAACDRFNNVSTRYEYYFDS